MNFNPFTWFSKTEKNERSLAYDDGISMGLIVEPSLAGISMSNEKALTVSSFYAGVRHIAEAFADLPVKVMVKQKDGGKIPDDEHPIKFLLGHEPNNYMNAVDYHEWFITQCLLYGNAHSKIDILNSGRVSAIHPIEARYITALWTLPQREITYQVQQSPFTIAETLSAYEVCHIHGLSLDAIVGVNPLQFWRESVSVSVALERYSANFFGQGCRPSGTLKVNGQLSEQSRKNIKESWKRAYSGTGNTGAVPLLEEGMEFEAMTSNNDEFQMNESKASQVRSMANWNKISPTKVGDLSRATWSNLEEENRQFVISSLGHIIRRCEQEYNRKLLLPSERATHRIEFDVSALLRGDSKTRYANNASALASAWLTVNEVREMEGRPPVEGGDVLRTPMNYAPATDPNAQDKPKVNEEEEDNDDDK